jgi:dTDP-4-dehydrorhamnose 3,5-epimerase
MFRQRKTALLKATVDSQHLAGFAGIYQENLEIVFNFTESQIAGCFEIRPKVFSDARGTFVKTLHAPTFAEHGLETDFPETFYSVSKRGVIRGLHFQTPPHDHAKLAYCCSGRILDVVVDLRVGSPTYMQHATFEIDSNSPSFIYVPRGLAHGFLALTENATVMYAVSTVHAPESDTGILWNSIGLDWPLDTAPIVSARDQAFPALSAFSSPFRWPSK